QFLKNVNWVPTSSLPADDCHRSATPCSGRHLLGAVDRRIDRRIAETHAADSAGSRPAAMGGFHPRTWLRRGAAGRRLPATPAARWRARFPAHHGLSLLRREEPV